MDGPRLHRLCVDLINPRQTDFTHSFGFDDFDHLAAFAVLGAQFYLAYSRQIAFVCLVVLGSAVLLEFAQLLTPDRHARILDAVENNDGWSGRHRSWPSILIFRTNKPPVPELTRSADIKINKGV
jgi:hypothetical protein